MATVVVPRYWNPQEDSKALHSAFKGVVCFQGIGNHPDTSFLFVAVV